MKKQMMNKESLEKLLALLPRLLDMPGNEWFKEAVRKMVCQSGNTVLKGDETLHSFVEGTRSYLIINPDAVLIDYDDIPDEKVREQLKADCFEMARHRFGRVNHKVDFDEFCRYANLQAEELINYFLVKRFNNNIDTISRFIEQYSVYRSIPNRPPSDVKVIDYGFKLFALRDSGLIQIDHSTLYSLKEIRNKLSHRSTFTTKIEDEILDKWNQQMPLTNDEKKEAITIQFRKKADFDNIYIALENLKNQIVYSI